jgi:hypothetical protein
MARVPHPPPKTELPLLNSERAELKEKLKQETIRADCMWAAALRHCTRVINESKDISEEIKISLLKEIWK